LSDVVLQAELDGVCCDIGQMDHPLDGNLLHEGQDSLLLEGRLYFALLHKGALIQLHTMHTLIQQSGTTCREAASLITISCAEIVDD